MLAGWDGASSTRCISRDMSNFPCPRDGVRGGHNQLRLYALRRSAATHSNPRSLGELAKLANTADESFTNSGGKTREPVALRSGLTPVVVMTELATRQQTLPSPT